MAERVEKKDIRNLSLENISQFLTDHGEKAFRAKQIDEWLWKKSAKNFDQIEDFGKAQQICDNIDIKKIHKRLDLLAKEYCPVFEDFGQVYH